MSMRKFRRTLGLWAWGLLCGAWAGGISSISTKLGLDGLHAMGVNVPQLSLSQMGYVFLSGVASHAIMYMMKSPIPPLEFDDTTMITKPKAGDEPPV